MKSIKSFLLTVCLFQFGFSFLLSQELKLIAETTESNCPTPETEKLILEDENIHGETMGQKLESLLFWSQEERERRFPEMYRLFPSIRIPNGNKTYELKHGKQIQLKFKDKTTLDDYFEKNHIAGVIVLHNNQILLEKYSEGVNESALWTSFSVAKSISSMLLGIALKDGDIDSMDDLLEKYIPELKGYDYGKVSVYQLLTMTSGIEWDEDYSDHQSDVAQMYLSPCENSEDHILSYMKKLKFANQPGTVWNYSTGETDLLGILIQKASGKTLSEYLSEKIWKPAGMEHCAYWLKDECSGLNIGGSGLSASLRDFARLGLLMLDNGNAVGMNLFSDDYLKNATRSIYKINESGDGYGYLWWRSKNAGFRAVGIFGQLIYVNPEKNLVIAQIATWPAATSNELAKNRQKFINAVESALKTNNQ